MNCHQILSGACNAGDRCFAVGSVEGVPFTVSILLPNQRMAYNTSLIVCLCLGLCGWMQYCDTGKHIRKGSNHPRCDTQLYPHQLFGLFNRHRQDSGRLRQSNMCLWANSTGLQKFTPCKFIFSIIRSCCYIFALDTPIYIDNR